MKKNVSFFPFLFFLTNQWFLKQSTNRTIIFFSGQPANCKFFCCLIFFSFVFKSKIKIDVCLFMLIGKILWTIAFLCGVIAFYSNMCILFFFSFVFSFHSSILKYFSLKSNTQNIFFFFLPAPRVWNVWGIRWCSSF